jgi:hypothetical protein
MLRSHSCLQASRQPTDLVQDGWLSHIRTPRLSPAWERTRGIHADGRCPSAYGGRHCLVGLVHGWNTRCRYGVPERSLPFTPYSLHAPETCSTAFLTAYRQSHHNTTEHCGNTPKTVLEGVWKAFSSVISQVCLRIGENAIRGNPSNATVQNALNPTVKRAESLSSCDWA